MDNNKEFPPCVRSKSDGDWEELAIKETKETVTISSSLAYERIQFVENPEYPGGGMFPSEMTVIVAVSVLLPTLFSAAQVKSLRHRARCPGS